MFQSKEIAVKLRQAYERDASGMLNAPWRFTWWQRGGEPGPDWLSDKVDLIGEAGHIKGRYTRTRNAATPPFRPHADEFVGDVSPQLAARLLRALFERRLFEQTLPSEGRVDLADAVRQTLELSVGSESVLKTLHEPTSAELGDIASACAAIASHLRDTGARRDVSPN